MGVCHSFSANDENRAPAMIPTRRKAKLPPHLSYPIGAQDISEALADLPHVESFSLIFSDRPIYRASEFNRWLSEQRPYMIMEAKYNPARKPGIGASNDMIEKGVYDEKCVLRVYPVLSERRHLANRLLREQGLPAIAQWLRSSHGFGTSLKFVELEFSPADESLAIRKAGV
jgi:hypothetical protein